MTKMLMSSQIKPPECPAVGPFELIYPSQADLIRKTLVWAEQATGKREISSEIGEERIPEAEAYACSVGFMERLNPSPRCGMRFSAAWTTREGLSAPQSNFLRDCLEHTPH